MCNALAPSRDVHARRGLASRNVIRQPRPMRSVTVSINSAQQTFAPNISHDKQAVLDAIHGHGPTR